MSRKTITADSVSCDYCGRKHGEIIVADGGIMGNNYCGYSRPLIVENRYCGHDICYDCWWYPGDMSHCPVCGPNRPEEPDMRRKIQAGYLRDWIPPIP